VQCAHLFPPHKIASCSHSQYLVHIIPINFFTAGVLWLHNFLAIGRVHFGLRSGDGVADLRDGSSERPDEQRAAARLLRAGPAGAAGPRARPLARDDADAAQGDRHVAHDPLIETARNQSKCKF